MGVECPRSNSGPDHRNITAIPADSPVARATAGWLVIVGPSKRWSAAFLGSGQVCWCGRGGGRDLEDISLSSEAFLGPKVIPDPENTRGALSESAQQPCPPSPVLSQGCSPPRVFTSPLRSVTNPTHGVSKSTRNNCAHTPPPKKGLCTPSFPILLRPVPVVN